MTGFKTLIVPLTWLIYFPIFEAINGQTFGKKLLQIYVVDFSGKSPTLVETILRRLTDPLELFTLGIPALIMINMSKKNQRLGDMIAGTTVVTLDAICKHCQAELELSPREVVDDLFTCPKCGQIN